AGLARLRAGSRRRGPRPRGRPRPAGAHARRRPLPPGAQRDRARQRPRHRSRGPGRRRRPRRLSIPDRLEWKKVVSDIASAPVPAPSSLPWGHWWRQVRAVLRLELRKGFRRSYGLYLLAIAPLFILVLRTVIPDAVRDPSD